MIKKFSMLAALTLAGCGAASGAPPAGPQFDGSYTGESMLSRGFGGYVCGKPDQPQQIRIDDGRFEYPFQYQPSIVFKVPVQVAADGTFSGQLKYFSDYSYSKWAEGRYEWVFVSGHIAGPTLDATMTSPRCTEQIVAQRN